MGLLGDVTQFAGLGLVALGVVYAYNRGVFDQILGSKGGGGEEEPKEKEEPKEEEPKAEEDKKKKEEPKKTTKITEKSEIEEIIEAAQPVPQPTPVLSCADYGGGCGNECGNGTKLTASACVTCLKCFPNNPNARCKESGYRWDNSTKKCVPKTTSAKLALAYVGSYYDGQVLDTAYYVTEPSMLIQRRTRGRNDIPMRVAIA